MASKEIQSNSISKSNTQIIKKIQISNKHYNLNFGNKKNSFNCIFYILLILIFLDISSMNILKESFKMFKSNEITMKIKGAGMQKIVNCSNVDSPNIIYLNEQIINIDNIENCCIIKITSQESNENKINTIKLIWNNSLSSMSSMFYGCSSLISLNLSNFDTSNVNDMSYMFYNCFSLISLDLPNFDSSNVNNIYRMFYNCSSLISLDLSNFLTSNVNDMRFMFYNCLSLISIDLSNFDTSNVNSMHGMFYNCSSLITLDLSNFDTSNVNNMHGMFYNCSSLILINLSNFITSNVNNMSFMFYNCSSLVSIDLSNFDTSNIKDNSSIFVSCENLKYINLKAFNESSNSDINNILDLAPKNIVIYLNEENNISQIMEKISEKNRLNILCSSDWKCYQNKLIIENDACENYNPEHNYEKDFNICYFYLKPDNLNEKIYRKIIGSILLKFLQAEIDKLIIKGQDGFNFYISNLENNLDFLDKERYKSNKFSKIYIGQECINRLKGYYENENISFIVLAYEKISDISSERYTQYEIYESLNLTKVNIQIYPDLLIDIYFPHTLSKELQNIYE